MSLSCIFIIVSFHLNGFFESLIISEIPIHNVDTISATIPNTPKDAIRPIFIAAIPNININGQVISITPIIVLDFIYFQVRVSKRTRKSRDLLHEPSYTGGRLLSR